MSEPLVFVNVLAWNSERWIDKCLATVTAARYPNFRTMVIDNASTDRTRALVAGKYPGVALIATPRNLGFAEGHNVGARHALARGAEYVAFLNHDLTVAPDWLAELMAAARERPEFGLLTPLQYDYEGRGMDPHVLSRLRLANPQFREDYDAGRGLAKVYEHDCSFGAALVARRDVLLGAGLFDPFLFIYHEEGDFLRRCSYRGFRMALVTTSRVNHWHGSLHPEQMPWRAKYYSYRNSLIVSLKNPGTPLSANVASCVVLISDFLRKNRGSPRGWAKSLLMLGLGLLCLAWLPLIAYKRARERRGACYL